ncbi:MAG: M43 family zinc metalloprotease [Puia sp.]|nr:M43 family zinc metalloprotease [Puia sp.]
MRRILFLIVLLLTRFLAVAQRDCRSTEYAQNALRKDPSLALAMQQVESFTRTQLERKPAQQAAGGISAYSTGILSDSAHSLNTDTAGGTGSAGGMTIITIPVVVHIIYNSQAQNIGDAQILSQIKVLNTDYRKLNADTAAIPSYFLPRAADCGFQFALAKVDTSGYATSGIIRKHTSIQAFALDDDMKYSATGGDDAWDRDSYLNIWVCSMANGVVGFSSVPGGPRSTDGIVVDYRAFGTSGTATAPFNLGRTATHEIGHWLNLIHTWGDAYCGNDYVDDTPQQQAADLGDPKGIIVSCGNGPYGDMYMNYMDLTNDDRLNMFTYGQRARMLALFVPGGCRLPILHSNGLGTPLQSSSGGSSPNTPTHEPGSAAVSIYPNPSVGPLSIILSDPTQIGSVMDIYNQLGQKVMSRKVDQLQMQLDISILQRGVYFIRIRDGIQGSATKLVKI